MSYPWETNQKIKPKWICRTRIFFLPLSCVYILTHILENSYIYIFNKSSVIISITTVAVILAVSTKYSHNDVLNLTILTILLSLGSTMAREKIRQATAKCRTRHDYLRAICFKKSCKNNDKEGRTTLPSKTTEHPRDEGYPWG